MAGGPSVLTQTPVGTGRLLPDDSGILSCRETRSDKGMRVRAVDAILAEPGPSAII
jgi:hypothetical protein